MIVCIPEESEVITMFSRKRTRSLAVLATGCFAFVGPAKAFCGPGCHISLYGACVVDGWGTVRNECPAGTRPRPPCPYGYVWRPRSHACFALN